MPTVEPTLQLQVVQGADAAWDFTVMSGPPNPAPLTSVFDGTETITGYLWPAGCAPDATLSVAPTCAWSDAPNALWRGTLTAMQTAALAPGYYRISARATGGSLGSVVMDLVETTLLILPGPGAATAAGLSPVVGPTAANLALTSVLYCTDEDIARRCGPDYTTLQPDSQMLARGHDGVFDSSDPWTLTSASNDFGAQLPAVWASYGVGQPANRAGYVVWLRKPGSQFPAGGILMAAAVASGHSLTLRRIGMAANQGLAPAPAAGLAGVEFQVATFYPQVEDASYHLNQVYTIDPGLVARDPGSLKDWRPLRRACVAMVLLDRYSDESRAGTGDYAHKVDLIKQELSDLRAVLKLRWGSGLESTPTTTWFSTRIVR